MEVNGKNVVFHWDHSRRQTHMACPRKDFFKYVMCLGDKEDDSQLIRGNGVHHGIAMWYEKKNIREAVGDAIERMTLRAGRPVPELHDLVTDALVGYSQRYPEEPFELIRVEAPMAYEFAPRMWYIGEVDGIIRTQDGILLVKETKSTTTMPAFLEQRYIMDDQTLGYQLLARKNGFPTQGILLDIVRVPNGRQTKYPDFFRSTHFPPDELIDEWERTMKFQAYALMQATTLWQQRLDLNRIPDAFYKNTRSCFDWNRRCGFFDVCTRPDQTQEILSLYPRRGPERELDILSRALSQKGGDPS